MMENNVIDDVYEYRYMDERLKKIRANSLKNFLNNNNNDDNMMKFVDLNMYLKPDRLNEQLYNAINQSELSNSIILNKYQMEILYILENHNLFLSAPTSFGKTFILLEFIKRNINKLNNIIFIIPTIALMNELLKKIYIFFGDDYNICTNGGEELTDKNIFIFVPERSDADFLNKIVDIDIDLLIYDEIYKLQPTDTRELNNDDRIIYMNKVYLDLVKKAKKIALLGPFINSVEFGNTNLDIVKYYTNYMPVYNRLHVIEENDSWICHLKLEHQLIYFKKPESIYKNISLILDKIPPLDDLEKKYEKEIKYLEENVCGEWYVVELLKRGIGIHHGKTPIFLRKFYENEYNNGSIKILLCTNTLMEGINTPTNSLIVVDDPGSAFKLNNLMGRVGRLNPSNPIIGEIIISSEDILNNITNVNDWLDLKILAEEEKATIDEEIIYLNKKYEKENKNTEINNRLLLLEQNFNIKKEDITNNNLEFHKVCKIIEENLIGELLKEHDFYNIIKLCLKIIPGPSYAFKTSLFNSLNTDFPYLPYKYYLIDLLNKVSFKLMVSHFNESFNIDGNVENINIFIDSLYVLNNFIKFKFSKIVDYLGLFDISENNELKTFIGIVASYKSSDTSMKILDDLGINDIDSEKIINIIGIPNNISSSKMIRIIKENKNLLINSDLNPFSINNINNM